jgi:hypothetical protein
MKKYGEVCWACGTELAFVSDPVLKRMHLSSHVNNCYEVDWMTKIMGWFDSDEEVKTFSFSTVGPWVFKWRIHSGRLGICMNADAPVAKFIPIFVPRDHPWDYEHAQEAAMRWIHSQIGWDIDSPLRRKVHAEIAQQQKNDPTRQPKHYHKSGDKLSASPANVMAEALKTLAKALSEILNWTEEESELRLKVKVGELDSIQYKKQLNAAFTELVRLDATPAGENIIKDDKEEFRESYEGAEFNLEPLSSEKVSSGDILSLFNQ